MLAKVWKKLALIILIIACLWNIVSKLVNRISFDEEIFKFKKQVETEQTNTSKN